MVIIVFQQVQLLHDYSFEIVKAKRDTAKNGALMLNKEVLIELFL